MHQLHCMRAVLDAHGYAAVLASTVFACAHQRPPAANLAQQSTEPASNSSSVCVENGYVLRALGVVDVNSHVGPVVGKAWCISCTAKGGKHMLRPQFVHVSHAMTNKALGMPRRGSENPACSCSL